jgi:hypothetical protein
MAKPPPAASKALREKNDCEDMLLAYVRDRREDLMRHSNFV